MKSLSIVVVALGLLAGFAYAQITNFATPPAVAAKLALRGDPNGVVVNEMRITRKSEVLVVQADLVNTTPYDRIVFYRFRWLDTVGNQVGDGESWKQLGLYGQQQQTIKSVAPSVVAADLRLEMNIELK